jgi:hypothetical protein
LRIGVVFESIEPFVFNSFEKLSATALSQQFLFLLILCVILQLKEKRGVILLEVYWTPLSIIIKSILSDFVRFRFIAKKQLNKKILIPNPIHLNKA